MKEFAKMGDIFVVNKNNPNSHNYTVGKKYVAIKDDLGSGTSGIDIATGFIGNYITSVSYTIIPISKETITEDISKLEKQIEEKKSILKWMEESKVNEYDPLQHKCWKCLQILNDKSTDVEKAKIIAELIENK